MRLSEIACLDVNGPAVNSEIWARLVQASRRFERPLSVWKDGRSHPIAVSSRAVIVEDDLWSAVVSDARQLASLFPKAWAFLQRPEHKFYKDYTLAGLSHLEYRVAEQDPFQNLGHASMRFDLYWSQHEKDFKIIETNCTIPAMQGYSEMAKALFLAGLGRRSTAPQNTLELLRAFVSIFSLQPNSTVAILHRPDDPQMAELLWLKKYWSEAGYPTVLVTPEHLSFRDKTPFAYGAPVSAVYRHLFGFRAQGFPELSEALLTARDHKIANPLSAHYESKAFLVFLRYIATTPEMATRAGLSRADRELVIRRIPPMSVLICRGIHFSDALLNHGAFQDLEKLLSSQDSSQFVFKQSVGYGGQSVLMNQSAAQIRKIVGTGLEQGHVWIVQEKVDGFLGETCLLKIAEEAAPSPVLTSCFFDASVFIDTAPFAKCKGGVSRCSVSNIVNIGTGGGLAPFFLESEWREVAGNA